MLDLGAPIADTDDGVGMKRNLPCPTACTPISRAGGPSPRPSTFHFSPDFPRVPSHAARAALPRFLRPAGPPCPKAARPFPSSLLKGRSFP